MDDRTWYLSLGTLLAAVLGMVLDALLKSFNVDSGYYPFLGIFSGSVAGVAAYRRSKQKRDDENGDGK